MFRENPANLVIIAMPADNSSAAATAAWTRASRSSTESDHTPASVSTAASTADAVPASWSTPSVAILPRGPTTPTWATTCAPCQVRVRTSSSMA
jgi:hypothetical protein